MIRWAQLIPAGRGLHRAALPLVAWLAACAPAPGEGPRLGKAWSDAGAAAEAAAADAAPRATDPDSRSPELDAAANDNATNDNAANDNAANDNAANDNAASVAAPADAGHPDVAVVDSGPRTLTIIHTSDFHDHPCAITQGESPERLGGIYRISARIEELLAGRERDTVLITDAGDLFEKGCLLAGLDLGESTDEAFATIPYDARVPFDASGDIADYDGIFEAQVQDFDEPAACDRAGARVEG